MIADTDIEHNTTGIAYYAVANNATATYTPGAKWAYVYNPGQIIWDGSLIHAAPVSVLPGVAIPSTDYLHVTRAFSATRIRGLAAGAIAHGATGTIDNVVGIDGRFSNTTAPVFLPTTHVSIADNLPVWAELRYVDGVGSRWEIYSADCQEA